MDFTDVRWLSFDCYGTLIDWESGILAAARPILARRGVHPDDNELLERYARIESDLERGDFHPYRHILHETMRRLAHSFGLTLSDAECQRLPDSLRDWPAFPDTPAALAILHRRFRLAIVSNVDDDLFAGTAPRLGLTPDALITAQQCRSYKPDRRNFDTLLDRLGVPPHQLIHVAQSLFHDIAPAKALGLRTIWINRRAGCSGSGATPPAHATPDLQLPDLASLASLAAPPDRD